MGVWCCWVAGSVYSPIYLLVAFPERRLPSFCLSLLFKFLLGYSFANFRGFFWHTVENSFVRVCEYVVEYLVGQ